MSKLLSRKADFLVLVGPSGSGKSTLITRLMKDYPSSFGYSVSHTTRSPREGEVNGKSYHFVDNDKFNAIVEKGGFMEYATVHNTSYGTSFASIASVHDRDQVCVMDLDIKGAQSLKAMPQFHTLVVFIEPPTFEILEERLRARGTEKSEAVIQKRLSDGREWVAWARSNKGFFDLYLTNDVLDECYEAFHDGVMSSAFGRSSGTGDDIDESLHSNGESEQTDVSVHSHKSSI